MTKLIFILLITLLLIVMLARDPAGMGHLVAAVITFGMRLLNAVALLITNLLGGHSG